MSQRVLDQAPAVLAAHLRTAVAAAWRAAREAGHPVAACAGVPVAPLDPLDVFAHGWRLGASPALWMRPDDGYGVVGWGAAWRYEPDGADRFLRARDAWHRFSRSAVGSGVWPGLTPFGGLGPIALAGFAFDAAAPVHPAWGDFPAGALVVPRAALAFGDAGARLIVTVVVPPDGGRRDAAGAAADAGIEEAERFAAEMLAAGRERSPAEGLGARPDAVSPYLASPQAASPEGVPPEAAFPEAAHPSVEEIPPAAAWKAAVAAASAAVRSGRLAKVVLARSVSVHPIEREPADALRRLRAAYPTCTLFAFARGAGCFLGATPERLARVHGREVETMALAGSAPRGATLEEDRRLGAALLAHAKDRAEHAVVAESLREALGELCDDVEMSATDLLRVPNVQHLRTGIRGRLRDGLTVLDVVARLHPTPAVGGMPREDALAWIRAHEGVERGWYAGPVGWLEGESAGEFAVAIRSAVCGEDCALLYSGCGIMGDSDPDAEYLESQLKLRPMLAALAANGPEPGRLP